MDKIEYDGYIFSVDIDKTEKYYSKQELCECPNCRNFYSQIKGTFPLLGEFLEKFGVDIERPDNVWSYENYDEKVINYVSTEYSVCGKAEVMGEYEIDIKDSHFLSITVVNDGTSPNRQGDSEHFTLCVNNFTLPWVLDEEFPKKVDLPTVSEEIQPKRVGFFRCLLKR